MILTDKGVLKLMQRIKSFIASQLNTKAASVHTHTISEIDDLSSLQMGGYTKSEVDTLLNGKSDTSHTHSKSQITDFPSYGTTANTICEGNDLRLSDARTPTSHTHTKSDITDFPSLATVATSGSYDDLSNKPTIPTVNNATLTIQQNGTTVDSFSANSSSDKTANIQCVDLTNNQTVGGIKTFSNAPVVSSISLDGKTIDTDANGNMTFDSHIVDTIEEQGNGYIRYSNGLQICWGTMAITWALQEQYASISFAKSFKGDVSVSLTHARSGFSPYTYSEISAIFESTFSVSYMTTNADFNLSGILSWTAIGRWK